MWPEKGVYFKAPRDDEGSSSKGRATNQTGKQKNWTAEELKKAAVQSSDWEQTLQKQERQGQGRSRIGP